MGGSLNIMPKATFDFRPSSTVTEATEDSFLLSTQMKLVNKKIKFSPNNVDLEHYIPGDKNWNYIIRKITLIEYENRSNFGMTINFYLQHYEQSSKDVFPCGISIPSTGRLVRCSTVVYEHPYPNDLTFYTYPTFRDQILNPERVNIDQNNKSTQFISTDSPFYYVYKDSYNDFCSQIYKAMEDGLVDKSISLAVNQADPPYARIDARAVDLFLQYIKDTKYSLLKFIDFSSSRVEFQLNHGQVGERECTIFKKDLTSLCGTSTGTYHDSVPIYCKFTMEYMRVRKTFDLNASHDKVMALFGNATAHSLNMNIFKNIPTKIQPGDNSKPSLYTKQESDSKSSGLDTNLGTNTNPLLPSQNQDDQEKTPQ